MEAETGVTAPRQGTPRITGNIEKLGRGQEGSSPRAFRESTAMPTP